MDNTKYQSTIRMYKKIKGEDNLEIVISRPSVTEQYLKSHLPHLQNLSVYRDRNFYHITYRELSEIFSNEAKFRKVGLSLVSPTIDDAIVYSVAKSDEKDIREIINEIKPKEDKNS